MSVEVWRAEVMADARLEQARALAGTGRFRDAMGVLKGLLQAEPQNAEARQLLSEVQDSMMLDLQIGETLAKAEALVAQGQFEQAQKLLLDVLKVSPGNLKAKTMLESRAKPAGVKESQPGPNSTIAMNAFDLDSLSGNAPSAAPPAEPPLMDLEPAFTLDSLDSLDTPFASTGVEGTVVSGSSSALAPAEKARVQQYVQEGKGLFARGQYQDAIDVWTRVFILDESNTEADTLIAQAKEAMNANQGEIEHSLTEAIAAFNAGDHARSRPLLEKILQSFPGHREALYYLSRINDQVVAAAAAPPQPSPVQPSAFSVPPPIFSPGRAETPAATTVPAASSPALSAGSPDDFEFEENLDLPTGEALRSSVPPAAVGGFEFDSPAEAQGFSAPAPSVMRPVDATAAPMAAGVPESFTWDQAPPADVPGAGAAMFQTFPQEQDAAAELPSPAVESTRMISKTKGAKGGGGIPWLMIGGAGAVLLLVGVGILFATKFFMGGEGPTPVTVAPSEIPKPVPPKIAPPPSATPVQPPAEITPQSMSPEALLRAARESEAAKDYAKAVALYQELVSRGGGLNSDAAAGLSSARAALQRQQAENERNEKFIKDYQYALRAYKEGDFGECLRIAWRLIYPDDTLARQLGKRDGVARLIRDGYYNWAVMDLKSENVRGADKNLRDLMDFDKSDPEARRLQQFARPYINGGLDQNYRDVVKGLTYRPFTETP